MNKIQKHDTGSIDLSMRHVQSVYDNTTCWDGQESFALSWEVKSGSTFQIESESCMDRWVCQRITSIEQYTACEDKARYLDMQMPRLIAEFPLSMMTIRTALELHEWTQQQDGLI